MSRLVIFGLSNMLGDVFDCALALGHDITRIVTNQPQELRPRTKSLEQRLALLPRPPEVVPLEHFTVEADCLFVLGTTSPARGDLARLLADRHGIRLSTLIHPTAYVSPLARLGDGVFIGARAVIGPAAEIGDGVFVNRAATVGHDTVVEAFARLQPGCNVGGHVRIGARTTIGMGANVIEELVIGCDAMVAAGAVVLKDVPPAMLVAGVPAQVKKPWGRP